MARTELRKVGGAHKELHRVLHAWCDLQSKYAAIEGEPAYDNSEAANTSLLVAAANNLYGWTAISELWIERAAKNRSEAQENELKLRRGLLDAYLATEEMGYLLELKQAWMRPSVSGENTFRYIGADPLVSARKQIRQLDYQGSFSKGQNFTSYYGSFLVPSYDRDVLPVSRKEAFSLMENFCHENFECYAILSPSLRNREFTREARNVFRPLVAIGLRVHCL